MELEVELSRFEAAWSLGRASSSSPAPLPPPFSRFVFFSCAFWGWVRGSPQVLLLGGCWRLGVLVSPLRPLLHHRAPRGPLLMGRIQAKPGSWSKIAIFLCICIFWLLLRCAAGTQLAAVLMELLPPPRSALLRLLSHLCLSFCKKTTRKRVHTTPPGHIQGFILRGSLAIGANRAARGEAGFLEGFYSQTSN